MNDSNNSFSILIIQILFGFISALLFINAITSIFIYGILGVFQTLFSGIGIGILGAITRRKRQSRIWLFVLIGSLAGIIISFVILHEASQNPQTYWNQWVAYTLPVAVVIGGIIASQKWMRDYFDQI
jgi:peptidoglycan/LPS O-acetylase OafA/YrhL